MPLLESMLRRTRARSQVGRRAQRALAFDALDDPSARVLYLHGVGGVGKTAFLEWVCEEARARGRRVTSLRTGEDPGTLSHVTDTDIFTLDVNGRLEDTAGLPGRLQDHTVPSLPDGAQLVMATRSPPPPAWISDPALHGVTRFVELAPWDPEEVQDFLQQVDGSGQCPADVLALTSGHPYALSLALALARARHDLSEPGGRAEISAVVASEVATRLVDGNPTRLQQEALDVLGSAREVTEGLLRAVVDDDQGPALFRWLQSQSCVAPATVGLTGRTPAREMLDRALQWRDPERYQLIHDRVRSHTLARLANSVGAEAERLVLDLVDLHRDNPVIRPYVHTATGSLSTSEMRADEIDVVLDLVERHEGPASRRLAVPLLDTHRSDVVTVRSRDAELLGFALALPLHPMRDPAPSDPALARCHTHLRSLRPLQADELAVYVRYWMSADDYQAHGEVQTMLFAAIARRLLAERSVGSTFVAVADVRAWEPAFSYLEFERVVDTDFEVGRRRYGVFAHDWRRSGRDPWLERLGERETSIGQSWMPPRSELDGPLSADDVRRAGLEALQHLHSAGALAANPLVRSRAVAGRVGHDASDEERVNALRQLVQDVVSDMGGSPRETKLERAVYHTHVLPGATQERVAELLGLPFSTYRRHLTAGRRLVAERICELELATR